MGQGLKKSNWQKKELFGMKLTPYKDLQYGISGCENKSTFILNFIPAGRLFYFLSTMIKEAASLSPVDSAKPAEQSFMDLILACGDHEKFKLFHSLGPAGGSQVTSARWRLNQLLIWKGMGTPVLWCWGLQIYFLLVCSSFRFERLRSLKGGLILQGRRDNDHSECRSSRTKTGLKRNVSGS